jgi:putative SOS response-associated peptidase YedK
MCTRYLTPRQAAIEDVWHVGRHNADTRVIQSFLSEIYPRQDGLFIRRHREDAGYSRELVQGRWGLIPPFATTPDVKFATYNARTEDMARKPSFRDAWARGQRCIIPADWFYEPNWESGRNVWWRFKRRDTDPWGLAGLWHRWIDPRSGDARESYTMLTLHANQHPLMGRMHKPELDPSTRQPLPPELQDKRSVIPIQRGDVDLWLAGTLAQALDLLKLAPAEDFDAEPEPAAAPAPAAPRAAPRSAKREDEDPAQGSLI